MKKKFTMGELSVAFVAMHSSGGCQTSRESEAADALAADPTLVGVVAAWLRTLMAHHTATPVMLYEALPKAGVVTPKICSASCLCDKCRSGRASHPSDCYCDGCFVDLMAEAEKENFAARKGGHHE